MDWDAGLDRDYGMFDRRVRPGRRDWNEEDAWESDREFRAPTRRSGWVASPVTARVDDDEWRERGLRDRERFGRRYDDDDDDRVRLVRRGDDRDRYERRTFDQRGPRFYRERGDRDTWYRPEEGRDVRYTRYDWNSDEDDWDWERREPRDYFTTVSYRDYAEDDRERERGREREIRYYRPRAEYDYDRDREAGLRFGRDYDQPSPRYYRERERDVDEWYEPGPYAGVGPRGYRRSPARVEEAVCDRLTHHGYLDATDINVQVEGDEVTLTGFVDSRWAKRKAEELAESVTGVRDVHNRLRIRPEGPTEQGEGYRSVYSPAAQPTGMAPTETATRNMAEGMTVWGEDGDNIGTVKDIRVNDFLVDRAMARDVYVPFDAVAGVTADGVRLTVDADAVDNMGWRSPDVTGSDEDNTQATTA